MHGLGRDIDLNEPWIYVARSSSHGSDFALYKPALAFVADFIICQSSVCSSRLRRAVGVFAVLFDSQSQRTYIHCVSLVEFKQCSFLLSLFVSCRIRFDC